MLEGTENKQTNASTLDSDENDDVQTVLNDIDDDSPALSEDDGSPEIHLGPVAANDVKKDMFVVVEFHSEKSMKPKYYVAKVLDVAEEIVVEYLTNSTKVENKFIHPYVPNQHPVDLEDIKSLLPTPVSQGTTSHTKRGIVFSPDFRNLNIQ